EQVAPGGVIGLGRITSGRRIWPVRRTFQQLQVFVVPPQSRHPIGLAAGWELAVIFVRVNGKGSTQLLQVINAGNASGRFFGGAQRRQQHGGENADNGNDNQQFDQGERRRAPPRRGGETRFCESR